jgi:hypothetical protein
VGGSAAEMPRPGSSSGRARNHSAACGRSSTGVCAVPCGDLNMPPPGHTSVAAGSRSSGPRLRRRGPEQPGDVCAVNAVARHRVRRTPRSSAVVSAATTAPAAVVMARPPLGPTSQVGERPELDQHRCLVHLPSLLDSSDPVREWNDVTDNSGLTRSTGRFPYSLSEITIEQRRTAVNYVEVRIRSTYQGGLSGPTSPFRENPTSIDGLSLGECRDGAPVAESDRVARNTSGTCAGLLRADATACTSTAPGVVPTATS